MSTKMCFMHHPKMTTREVLVKSKARLLWLLAKGGAKGEEKRVYEEEKGRGRGPYETIFDKKGRLFFFSEKDHGSCVNQD